RGHLQEAFWGVWGRAQLSLRFFQTLNLCIAALALASASEAGERIKLDGYILGEARAQKGVQGGNWSKPKALEWFEDLGDCIGEIRKLVKPEYELDLPDKTTIERMHHVKTNPEAQYFHRVKWNSWPNGLWAASTTQLRMRGSDTVLDWINWSYRC